MTLEYKDPPNVKVEFAMVRCTCCNSMVPGKKIHWEQEQQKKPEEICLWMPCKACEKWLGHLELDNKNELDGLCIDCFKEETDQ